MAKKKERMNIMTFLAGAKSSIPKEKRAILSGADKDIQELQASKTDRTKQIEKESGAESDVQKAIRERARKARRDLSKLGM